MRSPNHLCGGILIVMADYPGFIFYPGDYLRDTQNLSEKSQVAYDRIMCEHMRNICITQQQLKFFTKRLSPDEVEEVKMVLTGTIEGFFIKWVRESIEKSRKYSDSRRKNREGTGKKTKKKGKHIYKSYVPHMESESDIENDTEKESEIIYPFDSENFKKHWQLWLDFKKEQFKFIYKPIGLQGALKEVAELSNGNEAEAIKIILQSIQKGWKGFFKLNNSKQNGKQTDDMERFIDDHYAKNPVK